MRDDCLVKQYAPLLRRQTSIDLREDVISIDEVARRLAVPRLRSTDGATRASERVATVSENTSAVAGVTSCSGSMPLISNADPVTLERASINRSIERLRSERSASRNSPNEGALGND